MVSEVFGLLASPGVCCLRGGSSHLGWDGESSQDLPGLPRSTEGAAAPAVLAVRRDTGDGSAGASHLS